MTGDMDPKTNFALIVLQTELERYKFLVRSFLRVRLSKVSLPVPDIANPDQTPML
jgi:GINS complex subunit 4